MAGATCLRTVGTTELLGMADIRGKRWGDLRGGMRGRLVGPCPCPCPCGALCFLGRTVHQILGLVVGSLQALLNWPEAQVQLRW